MKHGHHPRHDFKPATDDVKLDGLSKALLSPGRNLHHYAICDGCDKVFPRSHVKDNICLTTYSQPIYGVRHKCLNCPDWDYCSECIVNARYIHPTHRFVPIYEPIKTPITCSGKHYGIYCDGPLCKNKNARTYIVGDRYKCAVCHDTDFCANCEASPINNHNRTHPLIKLKTPVKNVTVTTMSEKDNGGEMLFMGDAQKTRSTSTETIPATASSNAATQVQTVADLKPSEDAVAKEQPRTASASLPPPPPPPSYETALELKAEYVSDTVADGTKLPLNHVFDQTWTLLNPGPASWPSGCSLKFVGGDNMLALDPQHVSSLIDLNTASESNIITRPVRAGERVEFTVKLRTPNREGKCISYWRLTGPSGIKFGHKLWCDIDVYQEVPTKTENAKDSEKAENSSGSDVMIFPKLDKESPVSSQHESAPAATDAGVAFSPLEQLRKEEQDEMLSEVASLDDEDDDDVSFLTDDEYDVLDASDEDFLAEAQNGLKK
jgi:next to BRCA1 gene 1 protein